MNYNEYDSNGNKKKINFTDLFTDKTNRSRMILVFYLILLIFLVLFVRNSTTSKSTNEEKKEDNTKEEKVVDNTNNIEEISEFDEQLSYLLLNNYNFEFYLEYSDVNYTIEGKRFDDKYDFDAFTKDGDYHYIGVVNNMYAKQINGEEAYQQTDLPPLFIDCFDNYQLKEIIEKANKVDDYYEINNFDLSTIVNSSAGFGFNQEEFNTIKLDLKNNKIVGISIDFSKLASEIEEEETIAKLNLKYSNFGLIDDFPVNIE